MDQEEQVPDNAQPPSVQADQGEIQGDGSPGDPVYSEPDPAPEQVVEEEQSVETEVEQTSGDAESEQADE